MIRFQHNYVAVCLSTCMSILLSLLGAVSVLASPAAASSAASEGITAKPFPSSFQQNHLWLAQDMPCMLQFQYSVPKGEKKPQRAELVISLPNEVEVLASFVANPTLCDKPTAITTSKVDGRRIYRILIDPHLVSSLQEWVQWGMYDIVYLQSRVGAGEYEAQWWFETDLGVGSTNSLHLHLLPPIPPPAKPSGKFPVVWSYLNTADCPTIEVRNRVIGFLEALGGKIFIVGLGGGKANQWLVDRGWQRVLMLNSYQPRAFVPWLNKRTAALKAQGKPLDFPLALDVQGKEVQKPSPAYILSGGDVFWKEYIDDYLYRQIQEIHGECTMVVFDDEPGWTMEGSFAPGDIQEFKEFSKITDENLDAKTILSKYHKQWYEFRVMQNSKTSEMMGRRLSERLPKSVPVLCSDPLHAPPRAMVADWCALDVRQAESGFAMNMHMPYYSGTDFFDDMVLNIAELHKPYWPLIDPSEQLPHFFVRYTPRDVKLNIVASAATGAKGFGFWPNEMLDGLYMTCIAQGFDTVHRAEPFYFDGQKLPDADAAKLIVPVYYVDTEVPMDKGKLHIQVPTMAPILRSTVHRRDGELLFTLFNYSKSMPLYVRLGAAAEMGEFAALDAVTDQPILGTNDEARFPNDQSVLVALLPLEVRCIRLGAKLQASAMAVPIRSSQVQVAFEADRQAYGHDSGFQSVCVEAGDITFTKGWRGPFSVRMQTADLEVVIDPSDGGVIRDLRYHGKNSLVGYGPSMAEERFHLPATMRQFKKHTAFQKTNEPYQLGRHWTDEQGLHVELSRTFGQSQSGSRFPDPLEGLELVKTYHVQKDVVKVEVKYTNHGSAVLQIGPWFSQNLPSNGLEGTLPLTDGGERRLTKTDPINLVLTCAVTPLLDFLGTPSVVSGSNGTVCITRGGEQMTLSADPSELLGFYSFNGQYRTFELLFNPLDLAPAASVTARYSMTVKPVDQAGETPSEKAKP